MTNQKKLIQVAKNYINAHTRYMLYDCCDSMHDTEKYEAQWEILTDNGVKIEDFIKTNLFAYYQKTLLEIVEESRGEDETIEEVIENGAGDVLFPYVPIL
jgi:hypothetical protein